MPALDGLRALAVIAVVAYHADQTWARAGFLGVDVFFVISGYLITALLLAEYRREGTISISNFYRRRAARLLPGLMLMLAAVSVAVPLLAPDQLPTLRGDLLAALTYVSNWRLVFQNLPYFQAMGRPPLLKHLWSLAVEEQFYLVWPLLMSLALRSKGARKSLVVGIVALSAISAAAMAMMYSPEADTSRAYYGTDTRVGTILLGAALAFVYRPGKRAARPHLLGSVVKDFAGLGSIAALGWMVYSWTEFDQVLYRGGFGAVAVLSVIMVAVCVHPGRLTRRLLGNPPMLWIGRRSYAIYLWHWPVFMLTRPNLDIALDGYPLLALRLGITVLLAMVSHALVEKPARNGALGAAWKRLRSGLSRRSLRPAASGFAVMLLPAIIAAGVVIGMVKSNPGLPASSVASVSALSAPAVPPPASSVGQFAGLILSEAVPSPPPAPPEAAPPPPPRTVTALGDSVMLIARDALIARFASATVPAGVDAAVGRQAKAMIETAQKLRDAGQLGNNVIVHTGTNGPITGRQLDALMEVLKDVPRVFLVTVKVARPWEQLNNKLLADNIGRWPNARLVDWYGVANGRPEVFYKDGVHLQPGGVKLYVDLLSENVLR